MLDVLAAIHWQKGGSPAGAEEKDGSLRGSEEQTSPKNKSSFSITRERSECVNVHDRMKCVFNVYNMD